MTWICLYCGRELSGSKTHFCNGSCKNKFRRQEKRHTKVCEWCKTEYRTSEKKQRFCSPSCASKASMTGRCGESNSNWKGGLTLHTKGYVYEYAPGHPNSDKRGYILQHRLVVSEAIGRPLREDEIVDHADEDKQHNQVHNLHIYDNAGHSRKHVKQMARDKGRFIGKVHHG